MPINNERHLQTFLDLVRIDSPSGEEDKVLAYCSGRFAELGISVTADEDKNMIARLPGEGEPLMLNAHLDTVEPGRGIKPVVEDGKITSDGSTILGADNKVGVAAILELASALVEDQKTHQSLELVFTAQEEIGIVGAQSLNPDWITARQGLTLDGGMNLGEIITGSPYIYYMDVHIKGKTAHSGVEPEKGINALATAVRALAGLRLGRIDSDTTFNVGRFESGVIRNGVPSFADLKCEARSYIQEKALVEVKKTEEAFRLSAREEGSEVDFTSKLACHGYLYTPENDSFIGRLVENLKKHGHEPEYRVMGGGSDANAFSQMGIKALNVGTGTTNPHTLTESVTLSDLYGLPRILHSLVII